jgi:hypothetical protein
MRPPTRVFIAFQQESNEAAQACMRQLIGEGFDPEAIHLWSPLDPWKEPIFEVGRRIMRADIVLVIHGRETRRSAWVAAERRFARRVGVPLLEVQAESINQLSARTIHQVLDRRRAVPLAQVGPWTRGEGWFEIRVMHELELLELDAADTDGGVLSWMRRTLNEFDADLRVTIAIEGNLRFATILAYVSPAGMMCNYLMRPAVALAERFGVLRPLQPSREFGEWREALPTFVGGPHPFFDHFGAPNSAMWAAAGEMHEAEEGPDATAPQTRDDSEKDRR